MSSIKLTCEDECGKGNCPSREARLSIVASITNALRQGEYIEGEVVELSDSEGHLTVGWANEPSEYDKVKLMLIWELVNEGWIDHEVM